MPDLEKTPLRTQTTTNTTRAATSNTPIAAHDTALYVRFLELPVPVVLLALWLAGVALIGSCAASGPLLFVLVSDGGISRALSYRENRKPATEFPRRPLLGKLVDILCTMCSEARNKPIMWLGISYTRCARQMADISGVKVTSVGLRKVSWSRFSVRACVGPD
jgi:hypothetical protein